MNEWESWESKDRRNEWLIGNVIWNADVSRKYVLKDWSDLEEPHKERGLEESMGGGMVWHDPLRAVDIPVMWFKVDWFVRSDLGQD